MVPGRKLIFDRIYSTNSTCHLGGLFLRSDRPGFFLDSLSKPSYNRVVQFTVTNFILAGVILILVLRLYGRRAWETLRDSHAPACPPLCQIDIADRLKMIAESSPYIKGALDSMDSRLLHIANCTEQLRSMDAAMGQLVVFASESARVSSEMRKELIQAIAQDQATRSESIKQMAVGLREFSVQMGRIEAMLTAPADGPWIRAVKLLESIDGRMAHFISGQNRFMRETGMHTNETDEMMDEARALMEQYPEITPEEAIKRVRSMRTYSQR